VGEAIRAVCLLSFLRHRFIKTITPALFNSSTLNKALPISTTELKWSKYKFYNMDIEFFSPLFTEDGFFSVSKNGHKNLA